MPLGSTWSEARSEASETTYPLICPSPHFSRTGTEGWSRAMPPPTAMKSLWQAAVVCCAALNSAASRLSMTILRPLMPPAALHQSANAVACWGNSASRPGVMVLAASLNSAMLMVLVVTPRTEEAPPAPGSHILPTPGQTPLALDAEAPADVEENATDVPARIIVAMASGSADFRSWISRLQNILTPSPCDRIIHHRRNRS